MNTIPVELLTRKTLDQVAEHLSTGYAHMDSDAQVLHDFIIEHLYTNEPQLPTPAYDVAIITDKLHRWHVWEGLWSLLQLPPAGEADLQIRLLLSAWLYNPDRNREIRTKLSGWGAGYTNSGETPVPLNTSTMVSVLLFGQNVHSLEDLASNVLRTNNNARTLSARLSCRHRCQLLYLIQKFLPDPVMP